MRKTYKFFFLFLFMVNQQIKEYIDTYKESYSKETLKVQLIKSGYQENEIEEVFLELSSSDININENTPKNSSRSTLEKKRGTGLIIWLVLMLLVNMVSAFSYLLANSTIAVLYPNVPSMIFYLYGFLSLVNVVLVIMLFLWKRIAFYIFCCNSVIAFILNLWIGLGIFTAIFGFSGVLILYLFMKSKWEFFE